MTDQPRTPKEEEAIVGLKSDQQTLRQLTSSARAAKQHREHNKDEKAKQDLMEAIGKAMDAEKGSDSAK